MFRFTHKHVRAKPVRRNPPHGCPTNMQHHAGGAVRLCALTTAFVAMAVIINSRQAFAQNSQPNWATSRTQIQGAPHATLNTPTTQTQPQASKPRLRPTPGKIVQASAERVIEARPKEASKESTAEIKLGPGPDFESQLPDDDSHLIQFIEVMQWTVVVLLIAVVAVLALKKYGQGNLVAPKNSAIAHLATLPIKNHFQAHLLQIGTQKFLVTTDKSGVKTVNPIADWEDYDTPVQEIHETPIAA